MRINPITTTMPTSVQKNQKTNFKGSPMSGQVVKNTVEAATGATTGSFLSGLLGAIGLGFLLAKHTDDYNKENYTEKEQDHYVNDLIKKDCMYG